MSAWILPDHISDVLPCEAQNIERIRRNMLDKAFSYGYELVMPPLFEYLDSLLTGTGKSLDLQTFKLVDQISGKTLGLRADMTQQVARIDAHLLNRKGVVRLCYCGPVVHTWPDRPHSTREPLQLGAEIYGHAGMEADLEAVELSLACLSVGDLPNITVDFADVRIVSCLLSASNITDNNKISHIYAALAAKDASELFSLTQDLSSNLREAFLELLQLYGDERVLLEAGKVFENFSEIRIFLSKLKWLAERIENAKISFDLSDLRGYTYYSGMRFSIYADKAKDALVRGGRYDKVGAAYGRDRPAAGFSLDLKQIVAVMPENFPKAGIRSFWGESKDLRKAVNVLRSQGETVVCSMPGKSTDEIQCDRELIYINGHWVVQTL